MIKHHLKVAFRHLKRHKMQTAVSLFGLATGFVCFALSVLWIRYEMSYDRANPNAGRIYRILLENKKQESGYSPITPYPLADYLPRQFPEVESAGRARSFPVNGKVGEETHSLVLMQADSASRSMLGIRLLDGNPRFFTAPTGEFAVTRETAVRLFGNESPLGKEIEIHGRPFTIGAVVSGLGKHTNFPYDLLGAYPYNPENDPHWNVSSSISYLMLKPGTDAKRFMQKLREHPIREGGMELPPLHLVPLTALHYRFPAEPAQVKFNHLVLFAVAGVLVILCSLFNYLTLFVYSLRIRVKELALRKTVGSTDGALWRLIAVEILLLFAGVVLTGLVAIECTLPVFRRLSGIPAASASIYAEIIGYAALFLAVTVACAYLPVRYFRRKTLAAYMLGGAGKPGKNRYRQGSIALQLVISLGIMLCTAVLFKQIYLLRTADIGIARTQIGQINWVGTDGPAIRAMLESDPDIVEVVAANSALIPQSSWMYNHISAAGEDSGDAPTVETEIINASEAFIRFYDIRIVQGKSFDAASASRREIILNETAVRALGLTDPVGKEIQIGYVAGVMRDFYKEAPTMPVKPIALVARDGEVANTILYKYRAGTKEACTARIEAGLKKIAPDKMFQLTDLEDTYRTYLKSETNLLLVLGFVSAVCILVALFGIYSLTSLACQQRRKEIAVRKVNGATRMHILFLFYQEYLGLVLLAAAVAFPAGYLIMQPWTEQYVRRTSIGLPLFAGLLLAAAAVVFFCVLTQVLKTARANPAEVIKQQ